MYQNGINHRKSTTICLRSLHYLHRPVYFVRFHQSNAQRKHHLRFREGSQSTAISSHGNADKLSQALTNRLDSNNLKTSFRFFPPTAPDGTQPTTLANFCVGNKEPESLVSIYGYLRRSGTNVDSRFVPTVLKATGQLSMVQQGSEIHGYVIRCGMDNDIFVLNALIHMYSECGNSSYARILFDTIPQRDAVSWSTMITSYVKHKLFKESLQLIRDMRQNNVIPSDGGLISMVNLASNLQDRALGEEMHAFVIKNSHTENLGHRLSVSLIDLYGKRGNLTYAKRIFDLMKLRCIVSWTSIISGHIRCGSLEEAEDLLLQMVRDGNYPNEITMLSLIIACGVSKAIHLGKMMHSFQVRNGFQMTTAMATALIEMYGKCGHIRTARNVFNSMEKKDVTVWAAMISTYAQACLSNEGFELFFLMLNMGEKPNAMTMVSVLLLCAESGALEKGKWLHNYIIKEGVEIDLVLRTALLDMYAKCGDIYSAGRVFNESKDRDTGLWNAMINGLGMHGLGNDAIKIFEEMKRKLAEPNGITFVGVLHACAHACLVREGKQYFKEMVTKFGISPKIEHYGCMVDLFGRAGFLDEAHEVIRTMDMEPNLMVWGAFLAACKIHKNTDMAESATNEILKLEPKNSGYSTLMGNIYASIHRWDEVASVRTVTKGGGVKKRPGFSLV